VPRRPRAVVAAIGVGPLIGGTGLFGIADDPAAASTVLQVLIAATVLSTLLLVAALGERRQADTRADAAESRLRDAVESLGEGFALFDAGTAWCLSIPGIAHHAPRSPT